MSGPTRPRLPAALCAAALLSCFAPARAAGPDLSPVERRLAFLQTHREAAPPPPLAAPRGSIHELPAYLKQEFENALWHGNGSHAYLAGKVRWVLGSGAFGELPDGVRLELEGGLAGSKEYWENAARFVNLGLFCLVFEDNLEHFMGEPEEVFAYLIASTAQFNNHKENFSGSYRAMLRFLEVLSAAPEVHPGAAFAALVDALPEASEASGAENKARRRVLQRGILVMLELEKPENLSSYVTTAVRSVAELDDDEAYPALGALVDHLIGTELVDDTQRQVLLAGIDAAAAAPNPMKAAEALREALRATLDPLS